MAAAVLSGTANRQTVVEFEPMVPVAGAGMGNGPFPMVHFPTILDKGATSAAGEAQEMGESSG